MVGVRVCGYLQGPRARSEPTAASADADAVLPFAEAAAEPPTSVDAEQDAATSPSFWGVDWCALWCGCVAGVGVVCAGVCVCVGVRVCVSG